MPARPSPDSRVPTPFRGVGMADRHFDTAELELAHYRRKAAQQLEQARVRAELANMQQSGGGGGGGGGMLTVADTAAGGKRAAADTSSTEAGVWPYTSHSAATASKLAASKPRH